MSGVQDYADFRNWKEADQQKALALLQSEVQNVVRPFFCKNPHCNGQPHLWPIDERECPFPFGHVWRRDDRSDDVVLEGGCGTCRYCEVKGVPLDEWSFPHARKDQRPPKWAAPWLTLFLRGGRGSGKTRTGAEITNRVTERVRRITLIGATGPDLRSIMIEGDSGILAVSPPDKRPVWEPSKKQLTWPNGCIAQGYSAEEPDRLRGQNSGFVWSDEPAHWDLVEDCWDNMLYGLRKGQHPKILSTSTPKPTKWVKDQIKNKFTIDRVVSSYANLTNLSPMWYQTVLKPKEGTRSGRQELFGEILEDVEGSLWKWEMFSYVNEAPRLVRIVVSVDPAGTANARSDETGIIVLGIDDIGHLYVLADYTGKYSPERWGNKCLVAADDWQADAIVYEKNYGGEMVRSTIEAAAKELVGVVTPRLIPVTSRRGKELRAEPIVAYYEKGMVKHVGQPGAIGEARGVFTKLEEEQTGWVPGEGASPNRVDALVHGATNLVGGRGGPVVISSPVDLPTLAARGFYVPGMVPA